ncbi:hypothetical protein MTF65_07735 [Streptomyces sp. APSN-46.1]|uniref:hypothetical protein n=1 Tax=Streptomyces sp. APSN-46.1 TaxID=2929049 RepID=UPI001FB3DEF0|nr:hypothetical protein [Streptomyces sp. APSN-46.1]MCJ1677231.1 hypothetical protein [Streptomyces sp. APSN-46.1]
MRTSGPDMRKAFAGSALALLCVVTLASCTSDDSASKSADPCGISPSSEEESLVREVLGKEDFATKAYGSTSVLVDKMERALPKMPKRDMFYTNACGYSVGGEQGDSGVTFLAGWFLRTSELPSFPNDVSYELNGARGVARSGSSTLLVPCDLPGELGAQSQKVWLTADTTYRFSPSRPDVNQATRDQRMTLTYLMARRITEALGCENKPLEQAPVVKPLPSP